MKYKHQQAIDEFREKFGLTSEAMRVTHPNIWKDGLDDIEQFLDEQLSKKEEELLFQAKQSCLGVMISLGYALKWKDWEMKRVNQELNDALEQLKTQTKK